MRGYIVKKKGLYYYKCNSDKKCGCNKSAKDLHNQFQGILEELTLEEKYVDVFKDQLRLIYTELNANKDKSNAEFQMQINEIDVKLERLEERFINEEIKPDLYEKFVKKFRQETQAIEENMKGCPVSGRTLNIPSIAQWKFPRNSRPCGLPAITAINKSCKILFFPKESTIIRKKTKVEPRK